MADFTYNPQNIIDTAAGGIFGLVLGGYNDRRQYRQQEKLQALQIAGQKEMTDYQMMKQLEMWNNTNYEAQMEHIKKAGLNPGMIYGMKGGGGVTTGSAGGSVSGAQAPVGGREIQELMQQQIQMRLLKAQEENIKAQTNKTNVEADVIGGVQKEKTVAETENLMQGLDNLKMEYEAKRLMIAMQNIENYEKQASQEDRLDYIEMQAKIAAKQLDILRNEGKISDDTVQSKIEIVKQEAAGAILRNELTKANIRATNEEINKWKVELQQGWKKLGTEWEGMIQGWSRLEKEQQKIEIEKWVAQVKANYPGVGEVLGKISNVGIESLMEVLRGPSRKIEKMK